MDFSPPDSSVYGILQAKILEWLAILFSLGSSWPRIKAGSPALQADSLPSEPRGKSWPPRKGDDGNFWNETVFHVLIYMVAIWMNTDIQVHLGYAFQISLLYLCYTLITHTHQTSPFLRFYEANLSCYENIQIQSIQTPSLGICPLKSFV